MTALSDSRYSPSSRNGKVSSAAASVRTATSNYSASVSETLVVSVGNSPEKVDRINNGRTPSPIGSDELQQVINPIDFDGEVETNNGIPSMRVLRSIEDYPVLDPSGKTRPFKSLYSGHNVARRVLVIFVRHFFCGNCQEYLRTLSASIKPDALLALPVSTFVAVVGCGSHELIEPYARETGCPFPIYADPTKRLYQELGMIRTLSMGSRPAYLQNKSVAHTVVSGIYQGLRQVRAGLAHKSGDQRQVGGEFLFEPADRSLENPIATPSHEIPPSPIHDNHNNNYDKASNGDLKIPSSSPPNSSNGGNPRLSNDISNTNSLRDGSRGHEGLGDTEHRLSAERRRQREAEERERKVEEKCVTWCHRMRTTRDHAEVPELMEILGLEGHGAPGKNAKTWQRAITTRKGTGVSMAGQMGRMSIDTTASASASVSAGAGVSPVTRTR